MFWRFEKDPSDYPKEKLKSFDVDDINKNAYMNGYLLRFRSPIDVPTEPSVEEPPVSGSNLSTCVTQALFVETVKVQHASDGANAGNKRGLPDFDVELRDTSVASTPTSDIRGLGALHIETRKVYHVLRLHPSHSWRMDH